MKSARFFLGAFLSGAFHAPLLQPLNGFVAHFLCHQPLAKLTGMEEFTFLVSEGTPLACRISVGREPDPPISPNGFVAHFLRHQPLNKASGMDGFFVRLRLTRMFALPKGKVRLTPNLKVHFPNLTKLPFFYAPSWTKGKPKRNANSALISSRPR